MSLHCWGILLATLSVSIYHSYGYHHYHTVSDKYLSRSYSDSKSNILKVSSHHSFGTNTPVSKQIILFTPNNLRVHDNPCFNHICRTTSLLNNEIDNGYLLLLNDPNLGIDQSYIRALQRNIRRQFNTFVHVVDGDLTQAFDSFHQRLCSVVDGSNDNSISVITTEVLVEPSRFKYEQLFKHLTTKGIRVELLRDGLLDSKDITSDNYVDHKERYRSKRGIRLPTMDYSLIFNKNQPFPHTDEYNVSTIVDITENTSIMEGEDLAVAIVRDYLSLGDDQFVRKYQDMYVDSIASSKEHRLSLERLKFISASNADKSDSTTTSRYSSFFQGEVLSGLLSPMLSHGCLSPRLMYHCRQVLFPGLQGLSLDRPLICRVSDEAIRHDWHQQLVRWNQRKSQSKAQTQNTEDRRDWLIKYSNWRGYVQREALMAGRIGEGLSRGANTDNGSPEHKSKPILLLIHGFGGSINQYTGLARQLSDTFDVRAMDSLGFGQTEKPPLSYNQYLWRDQLLEYVERIVHERKVVHDRDSSDSESSKTKVFIAGNSIGGFFASSLAASISTCSSTMQCEGLILFNPSGDVVGVDVAATRESPASPLSTTTELEANYSPYKGPSSELLRLFGRLVFSLLQPRITATCQWLYPSNKEHVTTSGLAVNIFRDSCDPGAADVIAAGGKLPTPLTINDFFRVYKGPVLLAQGSLDPLNNATQRAISFGGIRENVTVDLLRLGHCPMDENPALVATSINRWMATVNASK